MVKTSDGSQWNGTKMIVEHANVQNARIRKGTRTKASEASTTVLPTKHVNRSMCVRLHEFRGTVSLYIFMNTLPRFFLAYVFMYQNLCCRTTSRSVGAYIVPCDSSRRAYFIDIDYKAHAHGDISIFVSWKHNAHDDKSAPGLHNP